MTKPPNFTECTICGREFGSKSIVIHERQCLQKLRRTEISKETEDYVTAPTAARRSKKKISSTAKSDSNSQRNVLVTTPTTSSPELLNLPKITTKSPPSTSKFQNYPKDNYNYYGLRPTTATLSRPKILNPEYIQYDMSLTRIDYTTFQPKVMDENHNNRIGIQQQQQRNLDETNRNSTNNIILPAVTGISAFSSTKGKHYKGIDSECKITKLPESTLMSLLGEPINKYVGWSDDAILPRYSGLPISIPTSDSCLVSFHCPNVQSDFSLKKVCPSSEHDDEKYNLPQITNVRTSDEPNEDNFNLVTPGHSACTSQHLLPIRQTGINTQEIHTLQNKTFRNETAAEGTGERHFCTDGTLTITSSNVDKHIYSSMSSRNCEQQQQNDASGRIIQSKPSKEMVRKALSSESCFEVIDKSNTQSIQEFVILKKVQPLPLYESCSESDTSSQTKGEMYQMRKLSNKKKSFKISNTSLPEIETWRNRGLIESDSMDDSEINEHYHAESDDMYTTADCGDAENDSTTTDKSQVYYTREAIIRDFERDSDSHSDSDDIETSDQNEISEEDDDDFLPYRSNSAPSILKTQNCGRTYDCVNAKVPVDNIVHDSTQPNFFEEFQNVTCNNKEWTSRLFIQPSVNTATTIPSSTPPVYSGVSNPIPQFNPSNFRTKSFLFRQKREEEADECFCSTRVLKSILKNPLPTTNFDLTKEDSISPITQRPKQMSNGSTFTGSDSDDEGSCNPSFTQLLIARNARCNLFRKRSRPQTRPARERIITSVEALTEVEIPEIILDNFVANTDSSPKIKMETEEYPSDLMDELTDLLNEQLAKQNSRRPSSLARNREQKNHERVKDWLESCHSDPDDPVTIWEGLPTDNGQPLEGPPSSGDISNVISEEFDSSPSNNSSYHRRVVSGILSAVFHIRELDRIETYKFTDRMKIIDNDRGRRVQSVPTKIPRMRRKNPEQNSAEAARNKAGRDQGKAKGFMTTLPLDKSTIAAIKVLSDKEKIKPRPIITSRPPVMYRPQTSPVPKIVQKRIRPLTPQVGFKYVGVLKGSKPTAIPKKTTGAIIPAKRIVQTRVQSCQVPERKSAYCQSSPPLETIQKQTRLNSNKILTKKPKGICKTSPIQSPTSKAKSPRLVRFTDTTLNSMISNQKKNNVFTNKNVVSTKTGQIPLFEQNKSAWVEVNPVEQQAHMVYQFHTLQKNELKEDDHKPTNATVQNFGTIQEMGGGCEEQRSQALRALEKIEAQRNAIREKEYERKNQQKESLGRKHTVPPSIFPSMYTLMVPKLSGEKYINLNIIVRRKGPDGKLPAVEEVVPEYFPEWMYLIVDEENITHTSPNPYIDAHTNHISTHIISSEDSDDDAMLPKIVTSNRSTIDSLSTHEAESHFLKCYICGNDYNCRELRPHEIECKKDFIERNAHLDKKYIRTLPNKPKETVTIQGWNKFAHDATKYKLIACPLCNEEFSPERIDEIREHMDTCKKPLFDFIDNIDFKPNENSSQIITPPYITFKFHKSGLDRDLEDISNIQLSNRYQPYKKPDPKQKQID